MPEINSSFLRNIGGIRIYSGANFLVPCKRRPEYAPFGCAFSVSIVHGRYFRFFRVFVFFFDFFFFVTYQQVLILLRFFFASHVPALPSWRNLVEEKLLRCATRFFSSGCFCFFVLFRLFCFLAFFHIHFFVFISLVYLLARSLFLCLRCFLLTLTLFFFLSLGGRGNQMALR